MKFENIIYGIDGNVATIMLNRPDISNGFNIPMCQEIIDAIRLVSENKDVMFLVIEAQGPIFSIGGDLKVMKAAVESDDISSLTKIAELVNQISYDLLQLEKPVVMCVDGAVAGAAANIALAADFVIASRKSKFIQAFVGVGLAPDAGGLLLLSKSIGITRAVQLALTGESLSAEKAEALGIVYKLCESDKIGKIKDQLLKRLSRHSINSYQAIKSLAWEAAFKDWEQYKKLELQLQESLAFKQDFKEGVRAHADRRRPNFLGK